MAAIRLTTNRIAFAFGLALSAALAFLISAAEIEKDVPYVPTPEPVVEEMLKLAKPTKGEILYDLGCGDGRIVVTAAKKYGVKGTGVDIDPERIAESNANAKQAGVTDQVKFVIGNLFEMDFRDANIITLYLLTEVNAKLRPKLLDQLKPGSRVVSHAFSMGDWTPEKEVTVEPGGQTVYFWVIPAKVQGTWALKLPAAAGADGKPQDGTLELKQKYQKVTGTATVGGKKLELKDAKLHGADFTFALPGTDGKAVKYTAKIDADTMKGKTGSDEFTGKRKADAPKKEPIEKLRETDRRG